MRRHMLTFLSCVAFLWGAASLVFTWVSNGPVPLWAQGGAFAIRGLPAFTLAAPLFVWSRLPIPDNSGVLSASPASADVYDLVHERDDRSGGGAPLSLAEGVMLLDGAMTDRLLLGALLDLARRAGAKFSAETADGRADLFITLDRAALAAAASHPWEQMLLPLIPEGKVALRGLLPHLRSHPHWKAAMQAFSTRGPAKALADRGYIHLWPVLFYIVLTALMVGSWVMLSFATIIFAPLGLLCAWLNWRVVRACDRAGVFSPRTRAGRQAASLWWEYRRWLETSTRLDEASMVSYVLWRDLLVDAVALGVATRFMDEADVKDRLATAWVSAPEQARYDEWVGRREPGSADS